MKKFSTGLLIGALATTSFIAGATLSVKKKLINPILIKESAVEENRKKAMRKRMSR
ncbi:hypothetical protein M2139_002284 [Enterococcus sp. PF1-24]|uniref:DUF3042 family protein n=1 Tax=unclassified Enterococcus TaxID=2608891 RepID=UPI002475EB65|nr:MULTISPECIES: DUF3042 family protein [unclassified Enterococcus]MDH6365287.1 hypothetical protein [Enterococcus sp. PFB1-1]MDH6402383.1 hypothetical protein [Enterococcus sp. PF1-24]